MGLERAGGVIVNDINGPATTFFVQDIKIQGYGEEIAGDVSPEGLVFISRKESSINRPLLVVPYEVSGTVPVFAVERTNDTRNPKVTEKSASGA